MIRKLYQRFISLTQVTYPLLAVAIIFNLIILVGAFFLWEFPKSFYIPFVTGGEVQAFFDRSLILIGVSLKFFDFFSEEK